MLKRYLGNTDVAEVEKIKAVQFAVINMFLCVEK